MDYGTHIKQTVGNVAKRSKQYVKQSDFKGSHRELRAKVVRELLHGQHTEQELFGKLVDARLPGALQTLEKDGLITRKNNRYQIA